MSWLYFQGWPRCGKCGLSEAKHTRARCRRMQAGEPIGGKAGVMPVCFDVDALPEPPPPNFLESKPPPRATLEEFIDRDEKAVAIEHDAWVPA